jgi:hypothetical protein
MSLEDLPGAQQDKEQGSEAATVAPVFPVSPVAPVAAVYGSALLKLNLLDSSDAVEQGPPASVEHDASSQSFEDAPDADAVAAPSSGHTTDDATSGEASGEWSAPAELNAPCGFTAVAEEGVAAEADTSQSEQAASATEEKTEAEVEVAAAPVDGPPSFERVIWEYPDPTTTAALSPGSESLKAAAAADFESLLLGVIDAATHDPRQLRHLVYELARSNLRSEAGFEWPSVTPEDIGALETAIARIELIIAQKQRLEARGESRAVRGAGAKGASKGLTVKSLVRSPVSLWRHDVSPGQGAAVPLAPERGNAPVEIVYPEQEKLDPSRLRRRVWLWFVVWPFIQLASVAGFCLALYLAMSGRPAGVEVQAPIVKAEVAPAAPSEPKSSGLPLPSSYGVYAVSNGSLSELQALPIRAPDPRVRLSAEITKPSATTLPDGKVVFILFQRELMNSAPQKLAVRVVARVASSLTYSSGKAAAVKVEASWHIRSNSFGYLVSPMGENREMVVVRPENPDFAFVPGRYALILGALAYDFTVDGPITDPAQCLESFEAVGGLVYIDCRPNKP